MQLSVAIAADGKDWRAHLADSRGQQETLQRVFPEAAAILKRVEEEVAESLEKIEVREKNFNGHLEELAADYRRGQQDLSAASAQHGRLAEKARGRVFVAGCGARAGSTLCHAESR